MNRKRKASDSTPSPRVASSDPLPDGERGDDGERPCKSLKRSPCTTVPSRSREPVERLVRGSKRKASEDAEAPVRKVQCLSNPAKSSSNSCDGPASKEKSAAEHPSEPNTNNAATPANEQASTKRTSSTSPFKSDEDKCYVLGNVSAEDMAVFEMSSTLNINRHEFNGKYLQLDPLGSGGFGSVFEGVRKSDQLPVAIKHIPANKVKMSKVICNGKEFHVILEIALMLKAAGLPGQKVGQSAAVSLLDWYTFTDELILVMEKPPKSIDLAQYLKLRGGSLNEREAMTVLKQLADAIMDMEKRGVFHRDIKPANVLIQWSTEGPRIRVIDFGCGSLSMNKALHRMCGTYIYFPPEWFDEDKYFARPTSVWQLGALFYRLLSGHDEFNTLDFIDGKIGISSTCSKDVQALLHLCLTRDPKDRILLTELSDHPALRNLSSRGTPKGDS